MYESGSGARQLAAKVESLLYMVSLCIILFVYLYACVLMRVCVQTYAWEGSWVGAHTHAHTHAHTTMLAHARARINECNEFALCRILKMNKT